MDPEVAVGPWDVAQGARRVACQDHVDLQGPCEDHGVPSCLVGDHRVPLEDPIVGPLCSEGFSFSLGARLSFVVFVGSVVAGIDSAGAGGGPASPS